MFHHHIDASIEEELSPLLFLTGLEFTHHSILRLYGVKFSRW